MWIRIWANSCPHCGFKYERGLGYEGYSRLGFEQLICPSDKCKRIFRTHSNEWNHMGGKTKLGYIFSGIMIVYVIWVAIAIGNVVLNGQIPGQPNELQEKINYSIAWLIFLVIVKMMRIHQSKGRCTVNDQTLSVGEMKWPVITVVACSIPGIMGLLICLFTLNSKWEVEGIYSGIVGTFFLGVCLKMRWQQVAKPMVATNPVSVNLDSTTAEDDWSRKHGF